MLWWTHRRAARDLEARRTRIRARIECLELERCELLADDRIPARKRRLDAVTGARDDLLAELGALE
ncbi:hypothetical protein WCD74_25440 [Actinomycetospora sp. OC33-EN08]|uniref:DUF465 domain-containing protein n=1 Tax=Actinomycetospora aurantiaca TaxID=3129233 RepID=A0ABU8MW34_9PSEU